MKNLYGNTYPYKDRIKAAGGKWDAGAKCWKVPDDKYDELFKVVGSSKKEPKEMVGAQLWEECPYCGNEPIYVPPGCCENCARTGRRHYG